MLVSRFESIRYRQLSVMKSTCPGKNRNANAFEICSDEAYVEFQQCINLKPVLQLKIVGCCVFKIMGYFGNQTPQSCEGVLINSIDYALTGTGRV